MKLFDLYLKLFYIKAEPAEKFVVKQINFLENSALEEKLNGKFCLPSIKDDPFC